MPQHPPTHLQQVPLRQRLLLHGPLAVGGRPKELTEWGQHGGGAGLQVKHHLYPSNGVVGSAVGQGGACVRRFRGNITRAAWHIDAAAPPGQALPSTTLPHNQSPTRTPAGPSPSTRSLPHHQHPPAPTSSVRANELSEPFDESFTSCLRAHNLTRRTRAPNRQSYCKWEQGGGEGRGQDGY